LHLRGSSRDEWLDPSSFAAFMEIAD